jgi:hypothetical protein
LLDQLPEQRFGVFAVNRFRGRRFVSALPVGNEPFALARVIAELVLPAGFANVQAPQSLRMLVEEQRVQRLPVGKPLVARCAGVRAGLNVPIVHERRDLTTNNTKKH